MKLLVTAYRADAESQIGEPKVVDIAPFVGDEKMNGKYRMLIGAMVGAFPDFAPYGGDFAIVTDQTDDYDVRVDIDALGVYLCSERRYTVREALVEIPDGFWHVVGSWFDTDTANLLECADDDFLDRVCAIHCNTGNIVADSGAILLKALEA